MLSVQLKSSQNDIESRLKNKDPMLKAVEWFDWIGLDWIDFQCQIEESSSSLCKIDLSLKYLRRSKKYFVERDKSIYR